jgi:hypothetical protein
MKKVLLVLLTTILIMLMLNGCTKPSEDEIWNADKFLEKYTNFEKNLMDFLSFHTGAVGVFDKDDERIEEFIKESIENIGIPTSLYSLHKTFRLETEIGTVFETESIGEGGHEKVLFPKTMVKDVILQLFDISENKINFQSQDFKSVEENEDNFGMIMVYGGGYSEKEILYDTLTYSTGTNIVTLNIKFYADSNPTRQFELCTVRYNFQPFMYKDKIQQYKFISAERVS